MTDFPCCVTGATQDPRIPAVTRALHDDSVPGCPMVDCEVGHAYYAKVAAVAIAAADAADATAGIRRVPASGICGDTFDGVLNGVLGPCCLPSGHSGWHCEERSDDVPPARWSHGESEPAGGAS